MQTGVAEQAPSSFVSCDTLRSSRGRPPTQDVDEEHFNRCAATSSEADLQTKFHCDLQRVKTLKKKYNVKRRRLSLPDAEELTEM